jgi:hypothetical protein
LGEFEGPSSTQINVLSANPIATRRIRVKSGFDDVHGIVTTTRYVRHNIKIRTMPTCHVCVEHQDQASMSILFSTLVSRRQRAPARTQLPDRFHTGPL